MIKPLIKQKKGQALSIIFFFIIMLAVFVLATLLMSFINTILTPFKEQIQPLSNQSASNVGAIQNSFNSVWDWAIVLLFFLNVIILLFSSFMVDIHPAFLIIYIVAVMLLMMFGSTILGALDALYNPAGVFGTGNVTAGGNAIQYMPLTNWFLNNFTMVILGIVILSGIIMYAKFKFGQQGSGNY
jgi:hypothetical protein